ncbi:unnamed protein product [Schistosoma bovis]|nr:unnamed protein product [Schistosoma bovis]
MDSIFANWSPFSSFAIDKTISSVTLIQTHTYLHNNNNNNNNNNRCFSLSAMHHLIVFGHRFQCISHGTLLIRASSIAQLPIVQIIENVESNDYFDESSPDPHSQIEND